MKTLYRKPISLITVRSKECILIILYYFPWLFIMIVATGEGDFGLGSCMELRMSNKFCAYFCLGIDFIAARILMRMNFSILLII